MPNYSYSTIARIGDLVNGIRVDTGTLAAVSYIDQAQHELFTVNGRVRIHQLFSEITVQLGAQAALVQYNFTSTTPAIGVQPMCAVSASVASLAVGERIMWVGGVVATAAVLTATPGISDVDPAAQIIGTAGGVGTVGILSTTASVTSGSLITSVFYTPLSDGAYITALV
jgi:ABC-type hemin transport system substrate-binding protein